MIPILHVLHRRRYVPRVEVARNRDRTVLKVKYVLLRVILKFECHRATSFTTAVVVVLRSRSAVVFLEKHGLGFQKGVETVEIGGGCC
jgi:hypothetical protein